ncbi:MAG: hypothetical protein IJI45_10775 [Anaerolineaceae bacterium]|nr:hypothetical protein [Oscillospiraceae bacterium]MBQ6481591.1 hypothetical protein [Anaerolineaceae bacterium]
MKSIGYIIGILLGIILVIVFYKFSNTNHKTKTQYDERQKELRGKAYQYAFYTLMIFEVLLFILDLCELPLPFPGYLLHFAGICLGSLVLASYCIWKDVYWGLNNNRKRYGILFLVCGILNAIPVIGAITHGGLFQQGESPVPAINLMVLILMVVIGTELLVKQLLEKREAEE